MTLSPIETYLVQYKFIHFCMVNRPHKTTQSMAQLASYTALSKFLIIINGINLSTWFLNYCFVSL